MQSLIVLGRQPAIGIAELESLYGGDKISLIGDQAVAVDVDPCLLAFDRLGGAVKFAKLLTELGSVNWQDITKFLLSTGPDKSKGMPGGKMYLGISSYGFKVSAKQVQSLAFSLKKAIKSATNRSVRIIPNNETALNSAQIIHGQLTKQHGWELLLIKHGNKTVIAQTIKVQDINAYARRDQKRPARDAKVGMLPPKLAQIIINLSVGLLPEEARQSVCEAPENKPPAKLHFKGKTLLDPFCGTGVVLQEGAIMGYDCIGSDINERMVKYAKANLSWLKSLPISPLNPKSKVTILRADATTQQWPTKPDFIASETYLGRPLSASDKSSPDLESTVIECDKLIRGFLDNLLPQIKKDSRICLAIPAWKVKGEQCVHLPLIDSLGVIGYNRVSFVHAGDEQLIYYRPNQQVARELLVLTKR